jgi:tRNA A-37 threonylcarbamoyl transferase component Bud32
VTEFIEGYHPNSLAELSREEATVLAKAINKLHSVGVAHGDIREQNIIFKTNVINGLRCYIIDFGNSTLVTSGSLLYSKLSFKSGAAPGIDKDNFNDYYWRLFESEFSAEKNENEEKEHYDYFRKEKLARFPSRFDYLKA